MHHLIFDIDGTLVESFKFDEVIYCQSIKKVIGIEIDSNWSNYQHITDDGILNEVISTNGLDKDADEIRKKIRLAFIKGISNYVNTNKIKSIPGAIQFINRLSEMENIRVSFATGGWYETALLKLYSAGFNFTKKHIFSSNDHYKRTEIIKMAQSRLANQNNYSCTYFGDAEWDKQACKELEMNFILVGNRTNHHQQITDFYDLDPLIYFEIIVN